MYRYEKMLHDIKPRSEDKNNAQQILNMQQQNLVDSFEECIIETAHKFLSMWEDLQEQSTDYQKLTEHTFGLLEQLEEVENMYGLIYQEKLKEPRIFILYSRFLSDVLHENTKSQKVMKL